MIILDTDVLSEPLRREPDANVMAWLQTDRHVAVTAISVGELLTGARMLPEGRRRQGLLDAIETTLSAHGEVLAYDASAAREYARLQQTRRASGAPLSVEDGMIAAICKVHGAALATRNAKDFHDLDVRIINPWEPIGAGGGP